MKFGSVCSGIEAASAAFGPLGWSAAWLSEIEPFPSAVLAHHYPGVPNLGDMTTIRARIAAGEVEAPDLFCGGTPCQSFSVAGLRRSLEDARGNLSLEFIRIADAIDDVRRAAGQPPAWILWENVPGVLSTADNAFGAFLGGLGGCESAIPAPVEGWPSAGVVAGPGRVVAWRVLDAQHFGVAQRRKRVFVLALAGAGGWAAADALLPISDRMRWHPAPRREAGEVAAPCLDASFGRLQGCSGQDANHGHGRLIPQAFGGNRTSGPIDVSPALNACHTASGRQDFETEALLVHAFDARQSNVLQYGEASGPLDTDGHSVGVLQHVGADLYNGAISGDVAVTLTTTGGGPQSGPSVLAFSAKDHGADASHDVAPTLRAMGHAGSHANGGGQLAVAWAIGSHAGAADGDQTNRSHAGGGPVGSNISEECAYSLRSGRTQNVATPMAVRRLTPTECERLQGFPDGYTAIPWRGKPADQCPDGPRYKALGNSWAVPCVRWIGRQIRGVIEQNRRAA